MAIRKSQYITNIKKCEEHWGCDSLTKKQKHGDEKDFILLPLFMLRNALEFKMLEQA
jgi:hypothetical protein